MFPRKMCSYLKPSLFLKYLCDTFEIVDVCELTIELLLVPVEDMLKDVFSVKSLEEGGG